MTSREDGNSLASEDTALAEFCSVTNCTPEQAKFYFEASNGNFDGAVSMFFEQEGDVAGATEAERHLPDGRELQERDYSQRVSPGGARLRHRHLLGILFSVPKLALRLSFGLVYGTLGFTAALLGSVASRALPAPVLRSIQGGLRDLREERRLDPPAAATAFAHSFFAQYGACQPHWLETSWVEATRRAHSQFKFLFVYLHSASHQDTEEFCQTTLCDPPLVEYINSHFLSWGGSISHSDAFQLAQGLRVRTYPYVALLAFSGSRTRLIAGAEGHLTAESLLPILQDSQEQQSINLVAEQAERNEQDHSRRLRQEQDIEYQRSLEADQERERRRSAATAAEAKAKQEAEHAAELQRAAQESEKQRREKKQISIDKRRTQKRAALGTEPDPGTPTSVQVRVRLPDGSNHQRRFLSADQLQKAYDFVDSLDGLLNLRYSLASSYPRRVLSTDVLSQSFQDLELTPQAMLFVQPEDED